MIKSFLGLLLLLLILAVSPEQGVAGSVVAVQIISGEGNSTIVSDVGQKCIQGNLEPRRQKRALKDFSRIVVDGAFDVQVRQQRKFLFEISGDSNLLAEIDAVVAGDELQITARRSICPGLPLHLTIGAPNISEFRSEGASNIQIVDIDAMSFTLESEGSSEIAVQGTTESLNISLSGAGDIQAFDLVADSVEINSQGAGDIQVFAKSGLSAVISGAGDVYYRGTPAEIKRIENGVGELIKQE